jgi:hypothetical protein
VPPSTGGTAPGAPAGGGNTSSTSPSPTSQSQQPDPGSSTATAAAAGASLAFAPVVGPVLTRVRRRRKGRRSSANDRNRPPGRNQRGS